MNERLRDRRKNAGLTQDELADTSGVSQSMISSLEVGRITSPSADIVERLMQALGCDSAAEIGYERTHGYQLIGGAGCVAKAG